MTDDEVARLTQDARDVLENPLIEDVQIRAAIDATIWLYTC